MTNYSQSMRDALELVYTRNQEKIAELNEKMSSAQIAKLKKAYEPMRNKKISTSNADKLNKLMDKVGKDKEVLIQIVKADIPFVSQSAVTKLITKHNMKGAEINKFKEEFNIESVELDEKRDMSAPPVSAKVVEDDGFRLVMKFKDGTTEALPSIGKPSMQNLKSIVDKNILKNPKRKAWVPVVSAAMKKGLVKEEVELDEGKMKEIVTDVEDAMGKIRYKLVQKGGKFNVKVSKNDERDAQKAMKMHPLYVAGKLRVVPEEADLDEAILKGRDYEYDEKKGVVKISKKNFAKVRKDAKGTDKSKPTMMVLTKKGTSLVPVQFEEVELDEDIMPLIFGGGIIAGLLPVLYLSAKEIAGPSIGKLVDKLKKNKNYKMSNSEKSDVKGFVSKVKKDKPSLLQKVMKKFKEEVEEAYEYGTTEYANHTKEVTPGQEVDEASARADAKRSMRRDPSMRKQSPFSKDMSATDDDVKAASKNIIMQMRKAVSLRGKFPVEFADKKKIKIPADIAQAVQQKYNSFKKPADKEKFQAKVGKSYKDMLRALREEVQEEKTILDRIEEIIKENKNG